MKYTTLLLPSAQALPTWCQMNDEHDHGTFTSGPEDHVRYLANTGQWLHQVLFRSDLPESAMFLEKDGLTWVKYEK